MGKDKTRLAHQQQRMEEELDKIKIALGKVLDNETRISSIKESCSPRRTVRKAFEGLRILKLSWRVPFWRLQKKRIDRQLFQIKTLLKRILRNQRMTIPDIQHAVYHEQRARCRLKEIALRDLFPGIEDMEVPLGVIDEETAHVNQVDKPYVLAMAKYKRAKKIFEFGTKFGQMSFYFASLHSEISVTTLDLPPEQAPDSRIGCCFKDTETAGRIRQIRSNSHEWDAAPFKDQMDFIFIDGDHSYAGVKNDTAKAFEMLAPGGIIVWHDFAQKSNELVRFISDFTQGTPLFHVKKTCLLVYLDRVNALAFQPRKVLIADDYQL